MESIVVKLEFKIRLEDSIERFTIYISDNYSDEKEHVFSSIYYSRAEMEFTKMQKILENNLWTLKLIEYYGTCKEMTFTASEEFDSLWEK